MISCGPTSGGVRGRQVTTKQKKNLIRHLLHVCAASPSGLLISVRRLLAPLFCSCQPLTLDLNGFSSSAPLHEGDFEALSFHLSPGITQLCRMFVFRRATEILRRVWEGVWLAGRQRECPWCFSQEQLHRKCFTGNMIMHNPLVRVPIAYSVCIIFCLLYNATEIEDRSRNDPTGSAALHSCRKCNF